MTKNKKEGERLKIKGDMRVFTCDQCGEVATASERHWLEIEGLTHLRYYMGSTVKINQFYGEDSKQRTLRFDGESCLLKYLDKLKEGK